MNRLFAALLRIGAAPRDDEEMRLRKALVLLVALMVVPLGVLWGALYWVVGQPTAASIPWLYAVLSSASLGLFAVTRRYAWLASTQLTLFLLLPFALMWTLGGFVNGSAVVLWALVAPLGALVLGGSRAALPWFIGYAGLVVLSGIMPAAPPAALAPPIVTTFFVLNIAGTSAVVFVLLAAFAGRRASMLGTVRGIVQRYLSPAVAESVLADPRRLELGGELTEVTVLFADLRGFTPYAESVAPDVAVALLNRYFSTSVPAILDEGGTVTQFAGDEVMAVFNAPLPHPDHPMRAARAALEIHRRISELAAGHDWPRFGIGINSGPAIIGNIGSEELRSFTAIGDTINLAARLQTLAGAGQTVVGPTTADRLRGRAELDPLGPVTLKGKASAVEAFVLHRLHEEERHEKPSSAVARA